VGFHRVGVPVDVGGQALVHNAALGLESQGRHPQCRKRQHALIFSPGKFELLRSPAVVEPGGGEDLRLVRVFGMFDVEPVDEGRGRLAGCGERRTAMLAREARETGQGVDDAAGGVKGVQPGRAAFLAGRASLDGVFEGFVIPIGMSASADFSSRTERL
jgi:hypothetical protein